MRFPRALSIRENLSVSDCITASGAALRPSGVSSFLQSGIQLSWRVSVPRRRGRWRTLLSSPSMYFSLDLMNADHVSQEKREEEAQDNSKGITALWTWHLIS